MRAWHVLAAALAAALLLPGAASAQDAQDAQGARDLQRPPAACSHGGGRPLLLLVQQGGASRAADARVQEHLAACGWRVTVAHQDLEPARAQGMALVVMSSSVAAKDVRPGWRTLAVPLLTWENDVLDDLAMTGRQPGVEYGEAERERYLWLVNAPHPLAAGLPAGAVNVYRARAPMSWGRPGLGASTIATLYGQPGKAAIFGYERGATMDYEALAPARRVMFFLGNDTFTELAAPGLRLFDAAIDWAAGAP